TAWLAVGLAMISCRSGYDGPVGIVARPDYRPRPAEIDMATPGPVDGGVAKAAAASPQPLKADTVEGIEMEGIEMKAPVGTRQEVPPPQSKKRPKPTYGGPPSPQSNK